METKTLLYLPHELIIQILMRLPVKSLICFKCVCKSWFSLISDPHFANSHFQHTSATHTRRFLCISPLSHEIRSIDPEAFLNDDPGSQNRNFLFSESYFPVEIRGSCRGFILLYQPPNIYVWNPSTGFKKQIPVSPFDSKLLASCHGFGYDQSRDDYLVVVFSHVSSHLEVFSFRDNMWKEIDCIHFPYVLIVVPSQGKGFLFNGVIHWLAYRRDLDLDVIVALDLMEKKTFEMPVPSDFDHRFLYNMWVFGEFLSLWAQDYDNDTIVIWVMKEYKMHSFWTKTLVLPLHRIPGHYFHPIHSTKNGDIIGRSHDTRLVKYNDKGQLLADRPFCSSQSEVVMYTESLLSLLGDNEHA
ncbi:putative F-box domain, galactose oxidase/kelch, beta-propeller, F-box associated interaction [Medicago truncatula]|uniref:F-box protein interaction domain protein n=1 Tax=Medicago truncatula TaxID=3880 RepID=A0A072UIY0_MEDTR|nr:F-box/kelch-repeat protein At3g06240 [Medicago truncatula]KEH29058.1 F-box protein interaction domain protein [Medicago truncatula]RHN59126.1 putative F-box domain, galactose oxidase/kelch, beta-propeller, F-box associated interaction [Medicago truncatula]